MAKNKLGQENLQKPRISRATSALAERKDPNRSTMSIHERLLAEKEHRQERKQQIIEEYAQKEKRLSTFQPIVHEYSKQIAKRKSIALRAFSSQSMDHKLG